MAAYTTDAAPIALPEGSYTVVNDVVPPFTSTVYTVNGDVNVFNKSGTAGVAYPNCYLTAYDPSMSPHSQSQTPLIFGETSGGIRLTVIATTGVIHASPLGTIEERCSGGQAGEVAYNTELTATRLNYAPTPITNVMRTPARKSTGPATVKRSGTKAP